MNSIYQLGSNSISSVLRCAKKMVTHPITSVLIGFPFEQWCHEKGHCLAADILYNNASPTIDFRGIIPSSCSYRGSLNDWGKYLGYKNSRNLIIAAGPLAEVAMLTTIAAIFSSKSIARRLLPFSIHLSLYWFIDTCVLRDGTGDFEKLLTSNTYVYGALTLSCALSTAFIAYRSFRTTQVANPFK